MPLDNPSRTVGKQSENCDLEDPLAFYPEDDPRAVNTVRELVERHPLLNGDRVWTH